MQLSPIIPLKILVKIFLKVYAVPCAALISSKFLCLIRIPNNHCGYVFSLSSVTLKRNILTCCLRCTVGPPGFAEAVEKESLAVLPIHSASWAALSLLQGVFCWSGCLAGGVEKWSRGPPAFSKASLTLTPAPERSLVPPILCLSGGCPVGPICSLPASSLQLMPGL